MKDDAVIKGRLLDLANKSYNENVFTFTNFLGLSEQSLYHQVKNELKGVNPCLFGGADGCERVMIRFGDSVAFGYEVDFPISVVSIIPKMEKYSESLTHRDCLGALMNLGIERDVLGDIIFSEEEIFVFCKDTISEFIVENLTKIRHTIVLCEIYKGDIKNIKSRYNIENIQIPSSRIDAVISKAFKLSRDNSGSLLKSGKVFLNGREVSSSSTKVKENDIISVRGKGRVQYSEELKSTKKGNLVVKILKFI